MVSYVRGTLSEIAGDVIVVEAGSIGIAIHVPLSVTEELPAIGEEVLIHTYLKVSEDALTLYGFTSRGALGLFRRLINVSGIGPKGALAVLSVLTPDDLRIAVLTGDVRAISRAPGIGPKTAQRVILELKDRVSMDEIESMKAGGGAPQPADSRSAAGEAIQALTQLGYSLQEAGRAVRAVEHQEELGSEELLKRALKQFRI